MSCRIAGIPAAICPSRRSSCSSTGTAASKNRSRESGYSEVDTDGDDKDSDEEFLLDVLTKCKWMGLAQFAMIPLVFALAKLRCNRLVLACVAVEVLISLVAQQQVRREVADWVYVKDVWKSHTEALNRRPVGILQLRELLVYFATLSEAKDPAMDAWTAANSYEMCTASVHERFVAAWKPIPVVGHTVGSLGLPGILLLCLCVATLGQMYAFLRKEGQVNARLDCIKQSMMSTCPDEAAHCRWRVWINMSHMMDVGGLMLLHDIFRELVQVEISLSKKVWPVPDRNASFRHRLVDSLGFSVVHCPKEFVA